jgi:excisionase family DNA binding protein
MFTRKDDYSRDNPPLLKVEQVMVRLNICRSYAYQLIKDGDIPSIRIRGAYRVRQEDLEAYIEKNIFKKEDT